MKPNISEQSWAQYRALRDQLDEYPPLEWLLKNAVMELEESLKKAEALGDFPFDLDVVIQNINILIDKNTGLEEKEKASREALNALDTISEESTSMGIIEAVSYGVRMVCCVVCTLVWVSTLIAAYLFVGAALDAGIVMTTGEAPMFESFTSMALVPAALLFDATEGARSLPEERRIKRHVQAVVSDAHSFFNIPSDASDESEGPDAPGDSPDDTPGVGGTS